jgi:hypothetical protein
MWRRTFIIVVVAFFAVIGDAAAQSDAPPVPPTEGKEASKDASPPPDASQVAQLAAALGADEYAARQAAEEALAAMGASVLPLLDTHLATCDDAEVLARMERIYRRLVPAPEYIGKSQRPGFLGVQMGVVSTEDDARLNERQWGVRVVSVVPDSAAEAAALAADDLIVTVDGEEFIGDVNTTHFVRRIQRVGEGGVVDIEYLRGNALKKTSVTLGGAPATTELAQPGAPNIRIVRSGPQREVTEQDVIDYRWSRWWKTRREGLRAAAEPPETKPAGGGQPLKPPTLPEVPSEEKL